jgi:hypothetical protein
VNLVPPTGKSDKVAIADYFSHMTGGLAMMPRCLQSIGLKVFIDEYEFFESRPTRNEGINYLLNKKISRNEAGAVWRLGAAKKLFSNTDLLHDALDYIANKST